MEQGRAPSAADVDNHFTLKSVCPNANLMLILNEAGWNGYTVPLTAMEMLRQHGGRCSELSDRVHHDTLYAPATFLTFLPESKEQALVHVRGRSVTAADSNPPHR